jgi:hypothetical protein
MTTYDQLREFISAKATRLTRVHCECKGHADRPACCEYSLVSSKLKYEFQTPRLTSATNLTIMRTTMPPKLLQAPRCFTQPVQLHHALCVAQECTIHVRKVDDDINSIFDCRKTGRKIR